MVFCVGVGRGLFLLRSILRRERIVGRRGGELYPSPFFAGLRACTSQNMEESGDDDE